MEMAAKINTVLSREVWLYGFLNRNKLTVTARSVKRHVASERHRRLPEF